MRGLYIFVESKATKLVSVWATYQKVVLMPSLLLLREYFFLYEVFREFISYVHGTEGFEMLHFIQ